MHEGYMGRHIFRAPSYMYGESLVMGLICVSEMRSRLRESPCICGLNCTLNIILISWHSPLGLFFTRLMDIWCLEICRSPIASFMDNVSSETPLSFSRKPFYCLININKLNF